MRKVLPALLLPMLLGGCLTDDSSPQACRYDATMALDQGNWDRAIDLLENNGKCRSAFTEEERLLNLAAAYIGRAGYDLLDLFKDIVNADDDEGDAADTRLIRAFADKAAGGGMRDLDIATGYYRQLFGGYPDGLTETCKSDIAPLSPIQKDACFNNGLLASAKAASTLALLLGDDLDAWLNDGDGPLGCDKDRNQNGTADEAEITACALKAAVDLTAGDKSCGDSVQWDFVSGYASPNALLSFADGGDGVPLAFFKPIKITVAVDASCAVPAETPFNEDRAGYRLIAQGVLQSPALTAGFCHTDMTQSCDAADGAGCWPCPVINADGDGALTITDTLIQTLNEDADALIAMLPEADRADAQADLDEFRAEICGTATTCVIDESHVADYLTR